MWDPYDSVAGKLLGLRLPLKVVGSSDEPSASNNSPRQPDIFIRQKVEKVAIDIVSSYFAGMGYAIRSVEKDNVGWDLHAVQGELDIRLEVKGLSGTRVLVELTPNDYKAMRSDSKSYSVCIVCNALVRPTLHIFKYNSASSCWQSESGQTLTIMEMVAARCSVQQNKILVNFTTPAAAAP